MSNIYDENSDQTTNSPLESLDLGSSGFEPTPAAPQFVNPFATDTGYTPAAPISGTDPYAAPPSYAQPAPESYDQAIPYAQPTDPYNQSQAYQAQTYPPQPQTHPGYSVYDSPQYPGQQQYPVPPQFQGQQAYAVQPYQGGPQMAGALIPGTSVQTPYGTFFVGHKSKLAAGLLGLFLGSIGVGRFYRGHVGLGVAQIAVTIVTCGFGALWGFIEGILVLVAQPGSPSSLDSGNNIMI